MSSKNLVWWNYQLLHKTKMPLMCSYKSFGYILRLLEPPKGGWRLPGNCLALEGVINLFWLQNALCVDNFHIYRKSKCQKCLHTRHLDKIWGCWSLSKMVTVRRSGHKMTINPNYYVWTLDVGTSTSIDLRHPLQPYSGG